MKNHFSTKIAFLIILLISVLPTAIWAQKITPEAYIKEYSSISVQEMERSGIPASITLAQGMFESGNGNSTLATEGNNHFGIKCHSGWAGKSMRLDDDAPNECFRKYENAEESYLDHTDFLRGRERYASLFELSTTDYKGWAHGLKKAGYATNPEYAQRLIDIIEKYNLNRLDEDIDMNSLSTASESSKQQTKRKSTDDFIIDLNNTHKVNYNNGVKYIEVKPGDTFEKISEEFGMKSWELYHYNDLPSGASIKYHKYLYIQSKRTKANAAHPTHKMRDNETIFAVSHKYGVKLKKLYKYNQLKPGVEPNTGDIIQLRSAKK